MVAAAETPSAPGAPLFHVDRGHGRPMVLLHGWGADHSAWTGVIRELVGEYRLIAIDLPGCGRSPGAAGPCTFAELSDEVAASIRALELDRAPIVVGHSMGGMVAQQLAVDHPELVDGLVVLDADLSQGLLRTAMTAIGHLTVPLIRGLAAGIGETASLRLYPPMLAFAAYSRDWRRSHGAQLADEAERFAQFNRADELAWSFLAYASRPDLGPALTRAAPRTLLIRGSSDRIMTAGKLRALQRVIPGSRLETLRGAGHMTIVEQPGAVAELLREYAEE